MNQKIYILDGKKFSTLVEFWEGVNRVFAADEHFGSFGRNLDAFRDVFATIDRDSIVIWKHSIISMGNLSYQETVNQLEKRLTTCHQSAREITQAKLQLAKLNQGEIVFEWLIKIIIEGKIKLRLE